MLIKTPKFWTKINTLSLALLPISLVYFIAHKLDSLFTKKNKISKPIICIGNLIAGGSGKTPTAIAIGKILKEMSINFAYLGHGYRSKGIKFLQLSKGDYKKPELVGEEALLLFEHASTFISKNRLFGTKKIEEKNQFKMILLDDGMQDRSIEKDLTILVIDGKIRFGNGFLIPAGPLRQTVKSGLDKANIIILINDCDQNFLKKLPQEKIVKAKIVARNIDFFKNQKLIAFCGLAYPEKFFSFLAKNNLNLAHKIEFSDHYQYCSYDLEKLLNLAKEKSAKLITTKKDWIKFPDDFQKKISYLDIDLCFENDQLIRESIKKIQNDL
jgi:tetraacyldisaccharide 4'-kinase